MHLPESNTFYEWQNHFFQPISGLRSFHICCCFLLVHFHRRMQHYSKCLYNVCALRIVLHSPNHFPESLLNYKMENKDLLACRITNSIMFRIRSACADCPWNVMKWHSWIDTFWNFILRPTLQPTQHNRHRSAYLMISSVGTETAELWRVVRHVTSPCKNNFAVQSFATFHRD